MGGLQGEGFARALPLGRRASEEERGRLRAGELFGLALAHGGEEEEAKEGAGDQEAGEVGAAHEAACAGSST